MTLERQFEEAVSDADAWLSMNCQCLLCGYSCTVAAPMSVKLWALQCGGCNSPTLRPTRILIVCGFAELRDSGVHVIKSLECKALEALYASEAE